MVRLGEAGVVSASLAGSAGRYAGGQTSLGYQYVRRDSAWTCRRRARWGVW
ncbi:hypothetical protein WJ968_23395 [Achromobacter xylosoxidans]